MENRNICELCNKVMEGMDGIILDLKPYCDSCLRERLQGRGEAQTSTVKLEEDFDPAKIKPGPIFMNQPDYKAKYEALEKEHKKLGKKYAEEVAINTNMSEKYSRLAKKYADAILEIF